MPFRRSDGLPPQAKETLPGRGMFAMTWRVHCRRPAAGSVGAHRQGQEGDKTPNGFLSPS